MSLIKTQDFIVIQIQHVQIGVIIVIISRSNSYFNSILTKD